MRSTAVTGALAASILIASQSFAQISPNPIGVQVGSYKLEPAHTRVQFVVNHFGLTDYWGDVTNASGTLELDPAHLGASKVAVSIPTASVSTTNERLDGELKSAQFLDAAAYPTISFVSTSITRTGARSARVVGDLTLHGVTRPVTLDATFNSAGANPMSKTYTVGFNATGRIHRSDFGVKAFVPMVSDLTEIRVSAAFEKTN